jgi:hypothetical protein
MLVRGASIQRKNLQTEQPGGISIVVGDDRIQVVA